MKKPLLFLILFLCCINSLAQESKTIEKFNGTWIWKSNENFHQIEIEQNNEEIKIKEKIRSKNKKEIERESIYFTDGRGEKNKFYEDRITESVTNFRKNKIVIDFFFVEPKSNKKMKSGSIELKMKNNNKLVWTQTNLILQLISQTLNQPPKTMKTFEKVD